MKTHFYIIVFLVNLLPVNLFSQTWDISWSKKLGEDKMDFFTDVVEDRKGGYVVLGGTGVVGNSYDFWVINYNNNGDTIWTKTMGTANRDTPCKIIQASDGGFLLLGSSKNENVEQLLLIKINEKGDELWRKTFNDGMVYSGKDLTLASDGGFVIAGSKGSDLVGEKLWMAKYKSTGDLVWEKYFENNLQGSFSSIKKLPGNGFALAGKVYEDNIQSSDIMVVRTDDEGEVDWITRIESSNSKDWPECVCCSTDSCLLVVGWKGICLNDLNSENAIFDYDLVLNKVNHKGELLWTKNFDKEGSEGGNAITVRPDGSFIVAGVKMTSFLGKVGPWLLHLNEDGNELGENLIRFHFNNDNAAKVINCSDGGFIVIGPGSQADENIRSDGWIIKFGNI